MDTIDRLKFFRIQVVKQSQKEFAEQLGMSEVHLGKVEIRKTEMSDSFFTQVCQTYQINPTWLETGNGGIYQNVDVSKLYDNERLKYLRENILLMSMSQLARHIGYNVGSYSHIEKGHNKIGERFLKAFCTRFGFSSEWIRKGTGEIYGSYIAPNKPDKKSPKRISSVSADTIGGRIRMVRDKLTGLSQQAFGKLIGHEQSDVSLIELGIQKPPREFINKLCFRLGVNKDWLISGNGKALNNCGETAWEVYELLSKFNALEWAEIKSPLLKLIHEVEENCKDKEFGFEELSDSIPVTTMTQEYIRKIINEVMPVQQPESRGITVLQSISDTLVLCKCNICHKEFRIKTDKVQYLTSCGCEYGDITTKKIEGIHTGKNNEIHKVLVEYKGDRYQIGTTKDKTLAYAMLLYAKKKIADGTFLEWFNDCHSRDN